MSDASDFLEGLLFDWAFRTSIAAPTRPVDLYAALFSVVPNEDGTGGTEINPATTDYDRVLIQDNDGTPLTYPAGSQSGGLYTSTSILAITWPTESTLSYDVNGWGIYDASTSGNLMVFKSTALVTVGLGQFARIPLGSSTITVG